MIGGAYNRMIGDFRAAPATSVERMSHIMGDDEKRWLDAAVEKCQAARERGVTVLFIRKQDANDEADIVVTNAATPEMARSLSVAISEEDSDE